MIYKLQPKRSKVTANSALLSVFKFPPKLFVLNTIIKDGYIIANINLNFDEKGNIKEDYKIYGSVKKVKLNIFNQVKLQNFNFNFNIDKSIYSLKHINMKLNSINITSPLIEIKKKKNTFFVNGQFSNDEKNFNINTYIEFFY